MFKCIVCRGLAFHPMRCSKCGSYFCEDEVKIDHDQIQSCPNQGCNGNTEKSSFNICKAEERAYNKLKVYRCPFNECRKFKKVTSLSKLIDHLNKNCQHVTVKCLLNCGESFLKLYSDYHYNECSKVLVNCQYCSISKNIVKMQDHLGTCITYLQ